MSSKDMFRKEQRFSFRKFSFGLASAVIANVIFGGAIANSPVVHANTTTETAAVATSERIASIPYTVNIVDQAGKVVETKEKKVLVYTVETIATATEYLTADLVPEGYAIVSGLGEVTLTEKAENVFTVKVDKIAPEAVATTTTAESATSETSTAAATPEPASLAATQPTPVTAEVAEAEVAPTTSEESAKPTERTVYLSYITHYVNEANETVDRTGHLVAVTTTDETAKTQVTVSASENMPSGWELVQDKAKVVVQLVENQTNILVFAVTKKSKEEEIAESQLSNKDVLEQVLSEGVLLSNDATRLLETSQAGNTGLEVATNNTKAVLKEAIQVFDEPTSTQEQVDAQTELVRAASKTLADELLKFDEDGVLTAMLDATTQAITITTSSKGAVRPDYENHIRAYATSADQRIYNGQDFFFGLIGKALTEQDSQIRAEAQASDGTTPTISIVGGGGEPIRTISNFGLQDNGSGVLYGTTTISEAGNAFSWKFKASSGNNSAESKFTFVPYTVVKTDNEPVRKAVTAGVTADEILAKVKSDVTRDDGSRQGPLNATFEEYFNSELTARATRTSTTVADDAKAGKQIWHEIEGEIPTTAGTHTVTVRSTNVHGQTIDHTVTVILIGTPTVTANTDGTVTVTPSQTDGVTKTVDVTYTDEAGVGKTVTATKEQDGNWTVPAGSEVTVDSSTGAVTIPANSVQNGSTVKAVAKDSTNYPSTAATAEALNPPTTVQDKQTIYVFNNTPIATVGAGSVEADNVNKVKVVTLQDPDGIKSVAVGEDGLGDEYKVDAEGYASGKPSVSALGKHGRSFAVTDNQNQVTNVLTATEEKQSTYVMDASATGEITKAAGESATADEILAKVTVDPGNERAHIEGTVDRNPKYRKVLAPGETVPTAPGEYTVTVRVITDSNVYKDVPVKVIIPKYSDTLTATAAENTSLVPGSGTAATQPIVINDANGATTAPAGTTYEIDPAFKAEKEALGYEISVSPTGEVSVKAPAGQEADITVPVTVTYPDKTTDSVSVPFKVNQKDLAQLKAKEAIDEKLADETKDLEDKKNAEIAAITNNPDLTPDQKDAAVKDITDAAEIAKKALNDAAGVAKDNVDAATTPEEAKAAQTAGETTLADLENGAEAALDLITAKAEAKDAIADKLADEVKELEAKQAEAEKAIDASTMTPEEKEAAKKALQDVVDAEKAKLEDAAKKATDAVDAATTPADVKAAEIAGETALTEAGKNAEAAVDLAKDKELAKEAIRTEAEEAIKAAEKLADDAIKAIESNPNLSPAEKDAEIAKVNAAAETALETIADNAKKATEAAENAQALADLEAAKKAQKDADKGAIDTATPLVDAAVLEAAKQDALNKLEDDAAKAKETIAANPNLSKKEVDKALADLEKDLAKAKDAVNAATTPEKVQTAEDKGVDVIAGDVLAAAQLDALNKLEDDTKETIAAIEANPNLTEDEKKAAIAKAEDLADDAKSDIMTAETPEAVQAVEEKADKDLAKEELKAATDDAKKAIDANPNLTPDEKKVAKEALDAEVAKATEAIDKAATPADVNTATLAGEKAAAKAEVAAAADDAKKAIASNPNLDDTAKAAAIKAVEDAAKTATEAIDAAKTPADVNAATLAGEQAVAKAEVAAAAADAVEAIKANPNLDDTAKAAAIKAVEDAAKTATDAIDAAKTPADVNATTLAGEQAVAKAEVAAAAADAIEAIKANPNLDDTAKGAAIKAVEDAAKTATDAIDAAKTPADVNAATLAGEQAVAKAEVAAAAADAVEAIKANPNLDDTAKAAAIKAVEDAAKTATEAIDAAKTPADVNAATLAGEQAVAKAEVAAAAADAIEAIKANPNLDDTAKAAAIKAVEDAAKTATEAIDAAKTPADVNAATLAGEQAVAKAEVAAAAADAVEAIKANPNLDEKAKAAAIKAVEDAAKTATDAIDAAKTPADVNATTLAGEQAVAKAEVAAAAADAVEAIKANPNLSDAEKAVAKDAVDASAAAANKAIDGSASSVEVQAAKDKGNAAIAENVLDAAKQGAKNKLMEEADKAKAAIDANPNLTPEEKVAAKAEIDKAVEEAIIAITGAGTHHALGEIKLPLSALIKPVVTVTPVLDPNNLTEEEIARIKALLEENNTFPEGTEIIVSKDASVSIKYPDGSIDLVLPAEIVKQADTTAPAITDDAKGNIVVAPTKEAVEFVVTYVDNNGKAQLVVVTKGADGKWTTTAKAVIVDPVTGQVIIPGSAIKPGTVVTAYSKDMAGNVSDLNSAEVEAVDANNPAAGVKVKSVTSTSNANKSTKKAKQLPNTGEKATSATSLGLAVLGMGLALFAAKRKKDEEEA
ncbi:TPA: DUF1542 domain-containing protein [Streptococcus suis]